MYVTVPPQLSTATGTNAWAAAIAAALLHSIVAFNEPAAEVNTGAVLSVIVITCVKVATLVLLHTSVAVQVSVTVPPHASGVAVNVDAFDVPLISQPPVNPLLKLIVLDAGTAPQATVIAAGAVIVGKAAGDTVMVLDTDVITLPHASVAVHVSVTVPPHPVAGAAEKVEGLDVPVIRHDPVSPFE